MQQHCMISRKPKLAPSFFEPVRKHKKVAAHKHTEQENPASGEKISGGSLMTLSSSFNHLDQAV